MTQGKTARTIALVTAIIHGIITVKRSAHKIGPIGHFHNVLTPHGLNRPSSHDSHPLALRCSYSLIIYILSSFATPAHHYFLIIFHIIYSPLMAGYGLPSISLNRLIHTPHQGGRGGPRAPYSGGFSSFKSGHNDTVSS